MAVDYFLKLDGIKGESKDSKHVDEIDILSWSWGLSQPGALATGGSSTGKVQFQDFHFTKRTDRSSPVLILKCAKGEHIKEGLITARKSGDDAVEFLKIKLTDVLVSSHQSSAGGDVPSESFSVNYAQVEYSYFPQKEDGTLGPPITAAWDLRKNEPI